MKSRCVAHLQLSTNARCVFLDVLYSLEFSTGVQKLVLKNIMPCYRVMNLSFKDYKDVLATSLPQKYTMTVIRSLSALHPKIQKSSLSSWDDKHHALRI